jgi:hypothetical protein
MRAGRPRPYGSDTSCMPEKWSELMIVLFPFDRRHRGRRHPFDFFIYTSAGRDACRNLIAPSRLLISTIEFLLSRGRQATPTILFIRPERFPQQEQELGWLAFSPCDNPVHSSRTISTHETEFVRLGFSMWQSCSFVQNDFHRRISSITTFQRSYVTILFITKDNLNCSGNLGVDASYKPEDGSVLMIVLFPFDRRHRGRRHPFDFFIYTSAGRDACRNLIAPSRLLISTIEFLLSRGRQATPTILFIRPERFPQDCIQYLYRRFAVWQSCSFVQNDFHRTVYQTVQFREYCDNPVHSSRTISTRTVHKAVIIREYVTILFIRPERFPPKHL